MPTNPNPSTRRRPRIIPAIGWSAAIVAVLVVVGYVLVMEFGPPTIPASSNPLPLSVAAGCPSGQAVHEHDGVANSRNTHGFLLPSDTPTAALVCRYQGVDTPSGAAPELAQSSQLNATEAGTLATAIRGLTLTRGFTGPVNCPAAQADAVTYLSFHYPRGPDVSLHYASTGCRSLDNGHFFTSTMGNDSFGVFQRALAATARME